MKNVKIQTPHTPLEYRALRLTALAFLDHLHDQFRQFVAMENPLM